MSEYPSFFRSFFSPYYLAAYVVLVGGIGVSVASLHYYEPFAAVLIAYLSGMVLSDVADYLLGEGEDNNDE